MTTGYPKISYRKMDGDHLYEVRVQAAYHDPIMPIGAVWRSGSLPSMQHWNGRGNWDGAEQTRSRQSRSDSGADVWSQWNALLLTCPNCRSQVPVVTQRDGLQPCPRCLAHVRFPVRRQAGDEAAAAHPAAPAVALNVRTGDEVTLVCAHLRTVTFNDPHHQVTSLWCDPCDRMRPVRAMAPPRTGRELAQRLLDRLERTEQHAPDAIELSAGERLLIRTALRAHLDAMPGDLGRDAQGWRVTRNRDGAEVRVTECCGADATTEEEPGKPGTWYTACRRCKQPIADDIALPPVLPYTKEPS